MLLRGEALRGIVVVGQRILYWIQGLELYCTKNCKPLFQALVERELSMYSIWYLSQWEPFHTILYYTILYWTILYLTILYSILYYIILCYNTVKKYQDGGYNNPVY